MANVTITPSGKYVFGSQSVTINAVELYFTRF